MRYELTDDEWAAIQPILPNKPRDVPRVNDRRVLNGIFWGLAVWGTMARPAGQLRPIHNLLQSIRSLATSGSINTELAWIENALFDMLHEEVVMLGRTHRSQVG